MTLFKVVAAKDAYNLIILQLSGKSFEKKVNAALLIRRTDAVILRHFKT